MFGRPLKLGIVIAGMLVGIAVGVYTATSGGPQPAAEATTAAATDASAAAKAAPVPAEQEAAPARAQQQQEVPKTNPHVRMSNVKLLQPPVKDSNLVPPKKKTPGDEESDEK